MERKGEEDRRKAKTILVVIFSSLLLLLLSTNFISGTQVTLSSNFPSGYTVGVPQINQIKAGSDYTFNANVYNSSTGYRITNSSGVNCHIDLYDSNGTPIVHQNMTYNIDDENYNILVLGGNLTRNGDMSGIINCQNGEEGGFNPFTFQITPSGFVGSTGFYLMIFGIAILLILLGFLFKDAAFVILGGMAMVFIGIYTLFNGIAGFKDTVYSWAIAIIILGVAGYLMIKGAMEYLE